MSGVVVFKFGMILLGSAVHALPGWGGSGGGGRDDLTHGRSVQMVAGTRQGEM